MNRRREIAKFVCGFETFHAIMHAYLWLSGNTLTVFGITAGPKWNIAGMVVNGLIAVLLGLYSWRAPARQNTVETNSTETK